MIQPTAEKYDLGNHGAAGWHAEIRTEKSEEPKAYIEIRDAIGAARLWVSRREINRIITMLGDIGTLLDTRTKPKETA